MTSDTFDLKSARHWARSLMLSKIRPGMTALDATMGNGHDALWLCEAVGELGRVFAFDVQAAALEATRARLSGAGVLGRATLVLAGHEHMREYVDHPVDAALFNLGWLPGGDKTVTTCVPTTLAALEACTELMAADALLTVCAYPGHGEGEREKDAVLSWASNLPGNRFQARVTRYLNQPAQTPLMLAIHKLK